MKPEKYLSSAIPTAETTERKTNGQTTENRLAELEARIEELNQLLIKQNRDSQDAMENVDEENLSESLLNLIKNLDNRVTALENANPSP